MDNHSLNYKERLFHELEDRKQRRPQYSLRSFAKFLDISPAHLSKVLSGQKNLSKKMANKIAERLSLNPMETREFVSSTIIDSSRGQELMDAEKDLSIQDFEHISRWYYYAILSLARTADAKFDEHWIAKRLGITPLEARFALNRLQKFGFINNRDGHLLRTERDLSTISHQPQTNFRSYHKEMLNHAIDKIDEYPISTHSYGSSTIAIDVKNIEKIKPIIRKFRREIADYLQDGVPTEVYNIGMYLIPLTKLNTESPNEKI